MFELIDNYKKEPPKFTYTNYDYARKKLKLLRRRLRSYFFHSAYFCKNDHPVLVALDLMNGIADSPIDLYFIGMDQVGGVIRNMNWVNEESVAKIRHRGYFYYNSRETYIATSFNDSLKKITEYTTSDDVYSYLGWETIRVVRHPYTDLSLEIPSSVRYIKFNGMKQGEDICVFEVDLVLLFVQYQIWRSRPESKNEDGSLRSRQQFMGTIVFPNMLKSHADVAFMNRLIAKWGGEEADDYKLSDRMAFSSPYQYIDDSIDFYHKKLLAGQMNANLILNTIILPSGRSLGEFFFRPNQVRVHQNQLGLLLPLLPMYRLVYSLLKEGGELKRAKKYINDFKYCNRTWRNKGLLKTIRGIEPELVIDELDQITEILG